MQIKCVWTLEMPDTGDVTGGGADLDDLIHKFAAFPCAGRCGVGIFCTGCRENNGIFKLMPERICLIPLFYQIAAHTGKFRIAALFTGGSIYLTVAPIVTQGFVFLVCGGVIVTAAGTSAFGNGSFRAGGFCNGAFLVIMAQRIYTLLRGHVGDTTGLTGINLPTVAGAGSVDRITQNIFVCVFRGFGLGRRFRRHGGACGFCRLCGSRERARTQKRPYFGKQNAAQNQYHGKQCAKHNGKDAFDIQFQQPPCIFIFHIIAL
jgi:hypothetical protein